jgi:hypothetical protein
VWTAVDNSVLQRLQRVDVGNGVQVLKVQTGYQTPCILPTRGFNINTDIYSFGALQTPESQIQQVCPGILLFS